MARYYTSRDRPDHLTEDYIETEQTEHTVVAYDANPGITRAQMILHFIVGASGSLLIIRFLLVLFGASARNGFVDLIYTLTNPLVAPFRGLFAIDASSGPARFEFEALIATIIYTLLGLAIVRFLDIFREHNHTTTTRHSRV